MGLFRPPWLIWDKRLSEQWLLLWAELDSNKEKCKHIQSKLGREAGKGLILKRVCVSRFDVSRWISISSLTLSPPLSFFSHFRILLPFLYTTFSFLSLAQFNRHLSSFLIDLSSFFIPLSPSYYIFLSTLLSNRYHNNSKVSSIFSFSISSNQLYI